jgi:hypothetical protein
MIKGYADKDLIAHNAPAYHLLAVWITEVAMRHGYAIGIHGSMKRDLDLIACPWTEKATSPTKLINAICKRVGGYVDKRLLPKRGQKPWGRRCWVIQLGRGAYIDISVMPKR